MREKKFQRLAALALCVTMLLGPAPVVASASETGNSGGSVTDVSLEELRELLNAISYDEYTKKHHGTPSAHSAIDIDVSAFQTEDEGFKMHDIDGAQMLYTPSNGEVSWTVQIPESGRYSIKIEYYPDRNRSTSIERILKINDKVPFSEARFLTVPKRWVNDYEKAVLKPTKTTSAAALAQLAKEAGYTDVEVKDETVLIGFPDFVTESMSRFAEDYGVRFFQNDINRNELRPSTVDEPGVMTYFLHDSTGYYSEDFWFAFEKGETTITLEGKAEPMSIKSITLYPPETAITYEEYMKKYAGKPVGQDTIKIEAELPNVLSTKTVYPVEDRSCAINSPTDATCSVLNTIGGEKWATAGQWIEYRFKVGASGRYDIVSRFRQNMLDGISTCRSMSLYSEGLKEGDDGYYNGLPFREAGQLVYDYDENWQVTALRSDVSDKDQDTIYEVYLEKDVVYTVRFVVTLGKIGEVVRRVEASLNSINNDYLSIIKLTGITPDRYNDYMFSQIMPGVMVDMVIQSRSLNELAEEMTAIAGEKSSNAATLEKVARLLEKMGTDDDEVAKNLSNLKSYIGTLGTFLSDVRTQPLQLDYITIQPAGEKLPKAKPTFWQSFVHEIKGFIESFKRDYNNVGALEEVSKESVEVWLATARDQFQVTRNLINNDFTPNNNIAVNLKLVAGGTLLPSILAKSGPDVYLGLDQGSVINYAIRSAVLSVDGFDDFEEVTKNFTDAAMLVLGIEDADEQMHYYGLPETQGFPMMFVRMDVLANLGLGVPKTWDELMACIPTLQANNMQIGLSTDANIFLYQMGGQLFADDGMRINLDSPKGLAAFEKMCNLFTMYSFPYKYDAANRFRTGEMPILIGDYTALYNQLKVFATEIEGKWQFMPLPGEIAPDGSINNVSVSAVSASVMIKGCAKEDRSRAWEFMKWYTGDQCQVDFSNEMVAIMGPSAKQAVSNKNALASLPWTSEEYEEIQYQFNNLAAVPNYPGAYIIARYTNFAFLNAYNEKVNPSEAMLKYVPTINKEIARKRTEFNLETLSDGKTDYKDLLSKRLAQMDELIQRIMENPKYSDEYRGLLDNVKTALKSDDAATLLECANAIKALTDRLDPTGEIYREDRIKVMGYDMLNTDLTKAEKKKMRKCYSYEVYRNTSEIVTEFRCMTEFLEDASRLTP